MDYLIIKYYSTLAFPLMGRSQDAFPEWAKVMVRLKYGKRTACLVPLERKDALRIIKDNNMVEVVRNKHGIVYDTPDKSFLKANTESFTGYDFSRGERVEKRFSKVVIPEGLGV